MRTPIFLGTGLLFVLCGLALGAGGTIPGAGTAAGLQRTEDRGDLDADSEQRSVTFALDSDDDGMPDSWEAPYGDLLPHGDNDGDGIPNIVEFQHDLDPSVADNDVDMLVLYRGWNLSTIPWWDTTSGGVTTQEFFAGHALGAIWGWNPSTLNYEDVSNEECSRERGYWVSVPATSGIRLGTVHSQARIPSLRQGWNLVVIPFETTSQTPRQLFGDCIVGPVWAWNSARQVYENGAAETASLKRAYWGYATEACDTLGFVISGTVTGDVQEGVSMVLSGDAAATTTTAADGSYSFSVVAGTYTITPRLSGYTFAAANEAVTVTGADLVNVNFVSSGGMIEGISPPTPQEQYLLELINRARLNPTAEAERYPIDELNEGVPAEDTISSTPKQPLAFEFHLLDSARKHSQWMLDNDTFSHYGDSNSTPHERMVASGYPFEPAYGSGENIAVQGTTGTLDVNATVAGLHEALFVDDNYPGRGHRVNMLSEGFRHAGVASVEGEYTSGDTTYNALMVTENFAHSAAYPTAYLTGVAYEDRDEDVFYTPEEGLGGVVVTAQEDGALTVYTTTTWYSGGYSLALPDGIYSVVMREGDARQTTQVVEIAGQNVKLDFIVPGGTSRSTRSLPVTRTERATGTQQTTFRQIR